MKRAVMMGFFYVFCILLCTNVASGSFWNGLSGIEWFPGAQNRVKELHATHTRLYFFWNGIEPTLPIVNTSLTVSGLRRHPSEIYLWASTKNWASFDHQLARVVSSGLIPVIEVGEGTHWGLPLIDGKEADPSVVGISAYLAYQYRFCRAVAHRYRGKVSLFQIENELNEAFLAGYYGQRQANSVWGNWTFLTQLLQTLSWSIHDEDPALQTTMNFHTDIPKVVHDALNLPGYYLDAVADWQQYLDIVSFDAYPNMYVASPSLGSQIGVRTAAIRNITMKPIFVMETGYPVNAKGVVPPGTALNFTEEMQATYISDAVKSAISSGCIGFFYFDLVPSKGMVPPSGGYIAKDESMMAAIRSFLLTNNVTSFVEWLLSPGDLQEVLSRASYFMGAPDSGGWGLVDSEYKPRKGFFSLAAAFGKSSG